MTLMMMIEDDRVPVGVQLREVLEVLDELGEAGDRLLRAIEDAKASLSQEGSVNEEQ